jgi:hypothetical protein
VAMTCRANSSMESFIGERGYYRASGLAIKVDRAKRSGLGLPNLPGMANR